MDDNIQWIFSGIGTNLLSLIVGCVLGYKIRDFKIARQSQVAGDDSNQRQEFHIENDKVNPEGKKDDYIYLSQNQSARDNSTQVQIGGVSSKRGDSDDGSEDSKCGR